MATTTSESNPCADNPKQEQKAAAGKKSDSEDESDSNQSNEDSEEGSDQEESIPDRPQAPNDENDDDWDENDEGSDLVMKKDILLESEPTTHHEVHCPHYPGDKYEWWYLYLVERKTKKFVTMTSCKTLDQEKTVKWMGGWHSLN